MYRSARGINSIELITKEFTEEDCVGEELLNDFPPDNCPAVNSLVPVILRKAIRDRAFKSFAAALTAISSDQPSKKFHPLPSSGLFLSRAFSSSFLFPDSWVLTAISHPSVQLGAKLVPEATQRGDPIEEKAEPSSGRRATGEKGVNRARARRVASEDRASSKKLQNDEGTRYFDCIRCEWLCQRVRIRDGIIKRRQVHGT